MHARLPSRVIWRSSKNAEAAYCGSEWDESERGLESHPYTTLDSTQEIRRACPKYEWPRGKTK